MSAFLIFQMGDPLFQITFGRASQIRRKAGDPVSIGAVQDLQFCSKAACTFSGITGSRSTAGDAELAGLAAALPDVVAASLVLG